MVFFFAVVFASNKLLIGSGGEPEAAKPKYADNRPDTIILLKSPLVKNESTKSALSLQWLPDPIQFISTLVY